MIQIIQTFEKLLSTLLQNIETMFFRCLLKVSNKSNNYLKKHHHIIHTYDLIIDIFVRQKS